MKRYFASAMKFVLLMAMFLPVVACGEKGGSEEPTPVVNDAYWKISSTVGASSGSASIIIEGNVGTAWHADVTQGDAWCSFSNSKNEPTKDGSITAGLNVLYVYFKANSGAQERKATIVFNFAGESPKTFELTQISQEQQDSPTQPNFTAWAEVPENKSNANYVYVAHFAPTKSGAKIRNFSLCLDKTKKAALWVAFPYHDVYVGTVGRTEKWAFDPFINKTDQADCVHKSYKGDYDRGHQLASEDRQATDEMNAQTFYMSNMTPQWNRLNQDMWAKLEAKVRSYKCSDTLYVVTGCHFGPNASATTDGVGNTVPIPTNYYKIVLRTKSGSTGKAIKNCSESELMSIGFWVDQKSYGNIQPPVSICTSVADIEAKTGFKFFPQAPASVKQQNNPSQWGIN